MVKHAIRCLSFSFLYFCALLITVLIILMQNTLVDVGIAQQSSQHKSVSDSVLTVLRTPNIRKSDPLRLKDAIDEAGRVKLTEAVDDLIKLITFNEEDVYPPPKVVKSTEKADRYPAASALFLIGRPALPALITLVENYGQDATEGKISAGVILAIFRDDKFEGIKEMRDAQLKAKSVKAKSRLDALIDKLEKL